jgi:hypothetical protein
MGYGNHDKQVWIYDSDYTADDLSATGDAGYIFNIVQPITVLRVGTLVTTVLNGPAVVAFDRRVTTDSDTDRVAALNTDGDGAITIPTTTAVGKIVYKDVRVDCDPGDQIVPEVTTGATSGAGRHFVEYIVRDETVDNLDDMVETA